MKIGIVGTGVIDRTGEEGINNFGSKIIISKYKNARDIDIFFPEYNWTAKNRIYSEFKKGTIKCPYELRYYNKGYLGEGIYKPTINHKNTRCYDTWYDMLKRCYNYKFHDKYPTYKECKVTEEWHNFQNFAKWYEDNYYEIENEVMCLDKDILVKGNKLYSSETCIFVPQRINKLFISASNIRGKYPIGVFYDKDRDKYVVNCSVIINGINKQKKIGRYNTSEEAFIVYKQFKENYIKEVADEYKDLIPSKLYEAMYNYEVEIND